MNNKMIIGVIVLIVLAGGSYLLLNKDSTPAATSTPETSSSKTSTPGTDTTTQTASATITYSNDGFSPGSTTVKSGDTIAIKNTSSNDLQLDSDPHPEHTGNTELNVGVVNPSQTKTFTVTKTGTFGIHNHLSTSNTATIIVQ